jgi:hypothetical protein
MTPTCLLLKKPHNTCVFNGGGGGEIGNMLKPQGLCVDKMWYISVGHLLPWIFPKHMAFKNIVYSLY